MPKPCVILLTLIACVFSLPAQQNQAHAQASTTSSYTVPPEAAHQPNPIKPTRKSIAQGKKHYLADCAICHGDNGDGKGEIAVSTKLEIGDFRNPVTLKDKTDGDLFYIIKNGHGQMLPEGNANPTELWNTVNYIRSLAGKTAQ